MKQTLDCGVARPKAAFNSWMTACVAHNRVCRNVNACTCLHPLVVPSLTLHHVAPQCVQLMLVNAAQVADAEASAKRIAETVLSVPDDTVPVLIAHNGPKHLGSNPWSISGVDFRPRAGGPLASTSLT